MDIAIAHDYLTQRGGAERVVLRLTKLFPGAPVYTALYDADGTFAEFGDVEIVTSALQGKVDPDRFRRALLDYPRAFRSFDLRRAGRVIISSSAFAHHVSHPRGLVYCHTPPRFLYRPSSYTGSGPKALAARALLMPLRRRDRRAASAQARYVANSRGTASRIRSSYGRDAPVVYPPLSTAHLPERLTPPPSAPRALVVARLLPYKRVDVALRACQAAGVPLTVVGEGPDENRLRRMAGRDATFVGRVPDEELAELFTEHSVLLAPGAEDFGYGPVEANYAGRPVVAIGRGGALETVTDGVTGIIVTTSEIADWSAAVTAAVSRAWDPAALRASTSRFGPSAFDQGILAELDAL